jgi:hypothetical protein
MTSLRKNFWRIKNQKKKNRRHHEWCLLQSKRTPYCPTDFHALSIESVGAAESESLLEAELAQNRSSDRVEHIERHAADDLHLHGEREDLARPRLRLSLALTDRLNGARVNGDVEDALIWCVGNQHRPQSFIVTGAVCIHSQTLAESANISRQLLLSSLNARFLLHRHDVEIVGGLCCDNTLPIAQRERALNDVFSQAPFGSISASLVLCAHGAAGHVLDAFDEVVHIQKKCIDDGLFLG